jgi:hypothetical protein
MMSTTMTKDDEESDTKHHFTAVSKTKNHNADSSSSTYSFGNPPRTHLSRQSVRECFQQQPGAFNITPSRVSRVVAASNSNRSNLMNTDGNGDDDIESTCTRSECTCDRENHSHNNESAFPGLIQAELVTTPTTTSSSFAETSEQQKPIQRAEIVEPIDPSWIKEQWEAQRKQEQQMGKLCCRGRLGMKWIVVIIIGLSTILLACLLLFLLVQDSTEQNTTPKNSTDGMSRDFCSRDNITYVCYDLAREIESEYPEISNPIKCVHVQEIEIQLRNKFNCTLSPEEEFVCDTTVTKVNYHDHEDECAPTKSRTNGNNI